MTSARVIAFPERRDAEGQTWEPWVDENVVARHFSVSSRTVRRWRGAGMPSQPVGALRRYRLSQCEGWHEQRHEGGEG